MNRFYKKLRHFVIYKLGPCILPRVPYFFLSRFPKSIIVEPTNLCNLKCPVCPTSQNMKREKGFMDLKTFKFLINDIKGKIPGIVMNFAGEPFLNKDLFSMIKYAETNGVKVSISTNSTFLKDCVPRILDSQLSSIIVCLDGTTKNTHEAYRVGSNFEDVKRGIKKLCDEKIKQKKKKPIIKLQFLVNRKNEHQINEIISLAKEFKVDFLNLKSFSLGSWLNVKRRRFFRKKFLPQKSRISRYKTKKGKVNLINVPKVCRWIRRSVVLWNGKVTTCCYDFNGENVFSDIWEYGGFIKLWKSKKYGLIRRKILLRKFPLCRRCNLTQEYGKFIKIDKNRI